LPELVVDVDESLFATAQETAAIVDVKEGHFLVAAFGVVVLDDFGEKLAIGEEHAADPVGDDAVVDDDRRDAVGRDLHDVLVIELIVEDDGAVDVGGDDLLDHRKGLIAAVAGGEKVRTKPFSFATSLMPLSMFEM
jgi:hypothetical protein